MLTCSSKALALPFQAFQVSLRAVESESAGADAEATGSNVVGGYEWPFGGEVIMQSTQGKGVLYQRVDQGARRERVNPERRKQGFSRCNGFGGGGPHNPRPLPLDAATEVRFLGVP